VAKQPHSPPQSTLVSPESFLSLLQWLARQVSPLRPTFFPLPATQLEPDSHWLLAVQTPTPLGQGQSVVHARSRAVLQVGLSTHTESLVDVPALVCV
jgi:hypothetical protein